MTKVLRKIASSAVLATAHVVTGVRGVWAGCAPSSEQRIYFANHTSHGDFVLIWTALPKAHRANTRPVAGADYWTKSALRRFFVGDVFNAVLIDRNAPSESRGNVLAPLIEALNEGHSLIFFPEGTRNTGEEPLLPFKTGLCHLARAAPHVPLVPVWIDNIGRVIPKGEALPVPLLCHVTFGAPLALQDGENRDAFLARARDALLALRSRDGGDE
ncbi:MAG TPA: lysophospholipid acyltransferase family protein [Methylocystis sp.]|nr:lysophospholipid acyltransferase family protein [Methylocystis sp.]